MARKFIPKVGAQVAPVYRINIGNIEVTALGDGQFDMPIAMLPLATQKEADEIHQRHFLASGETFEGSINSYLINTGDSLTLKPCNSPARNGVLLSMSTQRPPQCRA